MTISKGTGPRSNRLRLLAEAVVALSMIIIPALSIPIANPHSISTRSVPGSGFESKPVLAGGLNRRSSSSSPSSPMKRAVSPIAAPPPATPQRPAKEYDFDILNPAPNDVWVSGKLEGVSWYFTNLPAGATIDISFIPVDPDTNPEAKILTRRPLLRKLHALDFYTDIVVPYNLLTREQLLKEQKGDGADISMFKTGTLEGGTIPKESLDLDHANETMTILGPNKTTADITAQDFTSQARLVMSVYKGKTNTLLMEKSVFPVLIKRDHLRDLRTVLIDMEQLHHASTTTNANNDNIPNPIDERTPDTPVEGDGASDEHDGDDSEESDIDPEDVHDDMSEGTDDMSEGDDDMDMPKDMGHDSHGEEEEQPNHDGEGGHGGHSGQGEPTHEEHDHDHDPSHVIDPNHFQNDEDIRIWKEHEDEPGYNPTIKVEQAGTIQITKWIDNKERFFVGAPYVMAWEFPEEGQGLTGFVNVYVEDAETAKRYDIVAGNWPSDVSFMYLHPTEVMMSANSSKRIVLRARVELDLMKDGIYKRYTGFSKPFWVERGAL
ncbi:hypothetical protein BGZ93_004818 [Podila epicladia]|nr:hypothetical protein BGZ92_011263 [Podila epicladia]KAG0096258.1 hypothetical protein BGZ93_004818 [Podila epicladia]